MTKPRLRRANQNINADSLTAELRTNNCNSDELVGKF